MAEAPGRQAARGSFSPVLFLLLPSSRKHGQGAKEPRGRERGVVCGGLLILFGSCFLCSRCVALFLLGRVKEFDFVPVFERFFVLFRLN